VEGRPPARPVRCHLPFEDLMRRSLARLTTACIVAALLVPVPALAVEEPVAIDDPVAAFEPAEEEPAPAPAPADEAVDPQDGAERTPEVADETDAQSVLEVPVAAATTAPAATAVASGNGSLPFTGIGEDRFVLAFLVGSLLTCAGATLLAMPRRQRCASR